MIAFRLGSLGWTQDEIGKSIGLSQDQSGKILREFSDLKSSVKKLLTDGHPHLDVAERYNMPFQLVGGRGRAQISVAGVWVNLCA